MIYTKDSGVAEWVSFFRGFNIRVVVRQHHDISVRSAGIDDILGATDIIRGVIYPE